MVTTDKYILFWKDELSNFDYAPYTSYDGIRFLTTEQEFMYRKAVYFKDLETAEMILATRKPWDAKKLGRQVRGYNDSWDNVREEVMFKACLAKFSAHPEKLLKPEYEGKEFVEANPFDTIWAIGLEPSDPKARDKSNWRGQNLLGKVLERVRKILICVK